VGGPGTGSLGAEVPGETPGDGGPGAGALTLSGDPEPGAGQSYLLSACGHVVELHHLLPELLEAVGEVLLIGGVLHGLQGLLHLADNTHTHTISPIRMCSNASNIRHMHISVCIHVCVSLELADTT